MKQFRVILTVMLAVLMLASCGSPSNSESLSDSGSPSGNRAPAEEKTLKPVGSVVDNPMNDIHYELTKLCTIKGDPFEYVDDYFPISDEKLENGYLDYLHSYTGELLISEGCRDYEYFTDGFTLMYGDDYGAQFVNVFTGTYYLVDSDIQKIKQLNDRFYLVTFSDYARVYDVEKTDFVEGLMADADDVPELSAVGTIVFEALNDSVHCYRIYLEDGSVIDCLEKARITENGFMHKQDGGLQIYDDKYQLITTVRDVSAIEIHDIDSELSLYSDQLFVTGEMGSYNVIDRAGNVIISEPMVSVKIMGNLILCENLDGQYALFELDGTALTGFEYPRMGYTYLHSTRIEEECNLGLHWMEDFYGRNYYYTYGVDPVDMGYTSNYGIFEKGEDGVLIFSVGEFISIPDVAHTGNAWLADSSLGLVDVFSGNILLDPSSYEYVTTSYEHMYVWDGENWTVYQVELIR